MTSPHDAARAYARRGWLVFPCTPGGKTPATPNGFYSATTNPATIDRWWRANPNYNVAVRCGAGSRLWVVDRDDDDGGGETLARLIEAHGPLPPTLTSRTADGVHYYFDADRDLPNTAGKIGTGIDSRGRGGYVLLPPSRHPSGKFYRWATKLEPAAPPRWMVALATKQRNSERAVAAMGGNFVYRPPPVDDGGGAGAGRGGGYGRAALEGEAAIVAAAPEGARNQQLNVSAFRMGQLMAEGMLTEAEIVAALIDACAHNGLLADDGRRQCLATISSGIAAGLQKPREVC